MGVGKLEAVIFDLDDTLLDTSDLAPLRRSGRWGECFASLDLARRFPSDGIAIPVETLPAQVKQRGLATGLLTSSPRPYAEALLQRFGIATQAVITGSDGFAPKPDPSGLRAVAAELEIPANHCLYVGDHPDDFYAAANAGMPCAGVAWNGEFSPDWRRYWPDVAVAAPQRLLGYVDGNRTLGPLGEVAAANMTPEIHRGSLLRLGDETFALGRYFGTGDRRYPTHSLSQLIIAAKDQVGAAEEVAAIFGVLGERATLRPPDLVMSVPPAPDQDYDRFAPTRARLAEIWNARDGGGALRMRFAVPGYKAMGHDQRRAVNLDRFESDPLGGEIVVLIDDVLTSGGQADACREALVAAGAGGVAIMALGAAQEQLAQNCPRCDGILRTRRNSYTGELFLGCSNYSIGCGYTCDLPGSA